MGLNPTFRSIVKRLRVSEPLFVRPRPVVLRSSRVLVVAVFACLLSSSATADSERGRRLKIAGWTTTAVGGVLAITGAGLAIANGCSESQRNCNEEDMFNQTNGWITMSVGAATAIGIGMPMLIRSRKLSKRSGSERVIVVTPSLAGLSVGGRF